MAEKWFFKLGSFFGITKGFFQVSNQKKRQRIFFARPKSKVLETMKVSFPYNLTPSYEHPPLNFDRAIGNIFAQRLFPPYSLARMYTPLQNVWSESKIVVAWSKYHGLVLGLVQLIDVRGIDVAHLYGFFESAILICIQKKKYIFLLHSHENKLKFLVSKDGSKFWSSQTWRHFLTQTKYFEGECMYCKRDSLQSAKGCSSHF